MNENAKPIVKGNIMPSGHSAGNVYSTDGISATVMQNHGIVQYIMEESDGTNTPPTLVIHGSTK